jgi:hypothetical protein
LVLVVLVQYQKAQGLQVQVLFLVLLLLQVVVVAVTLELLLTMVYRADRGVVLLAVVRDRQAGRLLQQVKVMLVVPLLEIFLAAVVVVAQGPLVQAVLDNTMVMREALA